MPQRTDPARGLTGCGLWCAGLLLPGGQLPSVSCNHAFPGALAAAMSYSECASPLALFNAVRRLSIPVSSRKTVAEIFEVSS